MYSKCPKKDLLERNTFYTEEKHTDIYIKVRVNILQSRVRGLTGSQYFKRITTSIASPLKSSPRINAS